MEHRHLREAFVTPTRTGDIASLEALLTPDARLSHDDRTGDPGRVPVSRGTRAAAC
ncbi:hypothetical protein [Streptomyces sp. NPDC005485]|uniref:hypothetical protein n=1 Tax=Streptomyces sp. NPDC005485 TaxID=3155591 RepID=UPI0033B52544